MIKTICHFSDLHLKLLKDHDLYRTILSNMLEQFKELNPCRIVFTGDMVHSKNSVSPELIEMVSWILLECSKITKTIIIPGNHDFISNLERLDTLSPIINNLNNSNIVYYRDRGVYEDENVSWCVYSQFQGNVPPEICDSKGTKIGLFHGPIQGMKTELGFDFGDEAYPISKFDGLDVVLCGDIHLRQEFKIQNGKGYMIGSTVCQNYGEKVNKHGFGILNLETMNYEYTDLHNPKPFLSFSIKSFDDIINGDEKLLNG